MRKTLKCTSIMMVCAMILGMLLIGCGSGNGNDTVSLSATENTAVSMATGNNAGDSTAKAVNTGEKKKVVIVQEQVSDPNYDPCHDNIMATLSKEGYNNENSSIIDLKMSGADKKSPDEILTKIKEIRPDVVAVVIGPTALNTIIKPLEGSGIPVIATSIDEFVDTQGIPKGNVSGLYNTPKDLQYNAFKTLNDISPAKGKKAVFLTVKSFYPKGHEETVRNDLNKLGIDLEKYIEVQYIDEWQDAVKLYNNDKEVAWILLGVGPSVKKDGTGSQLDLIKWDIENRKKPSVTYWELPVSMGLLCGLGIDIPNEGIQIGEMAAKILKGEKISNLKAEYPEKVNIVLNQKNADQLGIKFPPDILGSAARIYMDYEGKKVVDNTKK